MSKPPTTDAYSAWKSGVDSRRNAALARVGSDKLSKSVAKELREEAKGKEPKGEVRIVFSMPYRQQCSGHPSRLCVDYTHRLVFEKYSLCVMGTVDPTQHTSPSSQWL